MFQKMFLNILNSIGSLFMHTIWNVIRTKNHCLQCTYLSYLNGSFKLEMLLKRQLIFSNVINLTALTNKIWTELSWIMTLTLQHWSSIMSWAALPLKWKMFIIDGIYNINTVIFM